MSHHVFSLNEVAEFLHISPADVETLVLRAEIPFERQGKRPVFQKKEIEAWASQRLLGSTPAQLHKFHKASSAKRHDLSKTHALIPELMRVECIDAAVASKTRASTIRALVKLADCTGLLISPEDLLPSLEEREGMCATALSGGIALLHPRHHDPYMFEDSFIVLGRTVQPIPFGSPDGSKTDLFFLVCCQDDRIHLHVLARLCMVCQQTSLLSDLREAEDSRSMYDALVRSEEAVIKAL